MMRPGNLGDLGYTWLGRVPAEAELELEDIPKAEITYQPDYPDDKTADAYEAELAQLGEFGGVGSKLPYILAAVVLIAGVGGFFFWKSKQSAE